jgi:hypothetical protein
MYDATPSGDTDQIVLTNHVRDSVSVSSDGYSQVITQDGTKPRTSGRRRNLRYSLRNTEFRRNGRSMPVAQSFNSTSGVEGADTSTLDIHTTEFIPIIFPQEDISLHPEHLVEYMTHLMI